ncbi:MAG: hypothetical protein QFX35_02815 [Candidatus Verstraetearchaeota archaeon]|nr:hypothetical protein [Candidatus Verstraetearchaeota archaeon]
MKIDKFTAVLESYQAGFVINSYEGLAANNIVLDNIYVKGVFGSFVHWYVPKSNIRLKSGKVTVSNFHVEYTDVPDYGHFHVPAPRH